MPIACMAQHYWHIFCENGFILTCLLLSHQYFSIVFRYGIRLCIKIALPFRRRHRKEVVTQCAIIPSPLACSHIIHYSVWVLSANPFSPIVLLFCPLLTRILSFRQNVILLAILCYFISVDMFFISYLFSLSLFYSFRFFPLSECGCSFDCRKN